MAIPEFGWAGIWTAIGYALSFAAAYAVSQIIYNIFINPLKAFPGPLIAKFTDAYGGYHSMHLSLPQATQRDLHEYGSVIRSGPNRLVFSTPQALQDIYNNPRVTKSSVYLVTQATTSKVCVFNAIDREVHKSRRKIHASAVSERAVRRFEPTMSEQIDIFLSKILKNSQANDHMEMSDPIRLLGSDVASHLSFGFPLQAQIDEKYRFLPSAFTFGNAINNVKMQWPLLSSSMIVTVTNLLTHLGLQRFYATLELIITSRTAQEKDAHADFYAQAVDSLAKDEDLRSDVWGEATFFFAAGSDTTATAMSSMFFYLSLYPESYKKLVEEVRTTFSSAEEIRHGPALASCSYLRACIDEALRISPPVGGTLWRQLHADEDHKNEPFIVDGHVIPPGTHVGVNCYAMHHNENYFPDPYVYKPERWLEADDETRRRMNEAFMPFSVGGRACAGKPVAYLESSLVIAKTLWYFDFERAPGDAGKLGGGTPGASYGRTREMEYQNYDIFASTQQGPNLRFKPRGDYWRELPSI